MAFEKLHHEGQVNFLNLLPLVIGSIRGNQFIYCFFPYNFKLFLSQYFGSISERIFFGCTFICFFEVFSLSQFLCLFNDLFAAIFSAIAQFHFIILSSESLFCFSQLHFFQVPKRFQVVIIYFHVYIYLTKLLCPLNERFLNIFKVFVQILTLLFFDFIKFFVSLLWTF